MSSLADAKLTLVQTWDEVMDFLSWVGERRTFLGLDLETSGLELGRHRIRLAQVGDANHGWAIPVGEWGLGAVVKRVLEEYDRPVALHNAAFDLSFLRRDGIRVPYHLINDTMVLSHLHESGYSVALKSVARREIDRRAAAGQESLDEARKKQKWGWDTVPVEFPGYWKYSALDPVLTARIAEIQAARVLPKFGRSYDIEMGAIDVLCDAQVAGLRVDVDHARQESARLESEMAAIRPSLPCNANSQPQIAKWLQEEKGANLIKRTRGGGFAVDDEVLESLEKQIPECRTILDYRQRLKLRSGYFENLLELQVDGVVHPQIRVLGAAKTGRMSISAPALQTLPKSKVGRSAFVAREGCTLLMADYSGQEMRLMAHMAREKKMLELFHEGVDLHSWVAGEIYNTTEPSHAQRTVAKSAAFAKIYGAGVEKFALTANITETDARNFIDRYDQLFPNVRRFQEQNVQEVMESAGGRKWGRITTWTGRELMVPTEKPYVATNYRIQGGCSEITKRALCHLAAAGLGPYVRLPIHDEIVFEVPDDQVENAIGAISTVMQPEEGLFDVGFPVDITTATRWGDAYE